MVTIDRASKRPRALRLKMQWLFMCSLGEMAGLGAAFAVGTASALLLGEPRGTVERLVVLGLMVGAGALEGGIAGLFQSRVLTHLFPSFPRRRFLGATAAVAAFGWAAGMSAPLFIFEGGLGPEATLPSTLSVLGLAGLFGAVVGLAFGGAQATALEGVARNRGLWVMGNVVGWAAGMPFTALLPSLLPDGSPTSAVVLTGAVGGLIAGAWVAVGTAPVVVHWAMLDELDDAPAVSAGADLGHDPARPWS